MKNKIIPLLIFILFFSLQVSAGVARIKDKDGSTNVRSGKGTEFPVIATLNTSDLFFCDRSSDEWIKITVLTKYADGTNLEGYIHKSRIEFLEDIDNSKKKEMLETTFTTYQKLIKRLQRLVDAKDYDKANEFKWEPSNYSDAVYSSVLEILPSYLKETKDTETLQLFFTTMWVDSGSANETPAFTIGECYVDQPDFILQQVQLLKNKELRTMIFDDIEHGLDFHYDFDLWANKPTKKELQTLKELQNKLENARKRN